MSFFSSFFLLVAKNWEKLHSWASNELVFAPAETLTSRSIGRRRATWLTSWLTGSGERPLRWQLGRSKRWQASPSASSLTHIGFRCTSWRQYCVLCALLKVAVIVSCLERRFPPPRFKMRFFNDPEMLLFLMCCTALYCAEWWTWCFILQYLEGSWTVHAQYWLLRDYELILAVN